jgi:hypothetical protein
MKNLFLIIAFIFVSTQTNFSNPIVEEVSESQLIVILNTAGWCPACQANGERVKTEVISKFASNPSYQIVINDLTDDATKAKSKTSCEKAGVLSFASDNTATGIIYILNAKTKELVSSVSVTKSSEEIAKVLETALKS